MPSSPPLAVVVPVKGGPLAKSRLPLPRADRMALADAFARDTVAAAASLPGVRVLVVTGDPVVAAWAEVVAQVVPDPGGGLDAAVRAGVAAARTTGAGRAVVLLGDHPALTGTELAATLERTGRLPRAVVPDADGTGTALLDLALDDGPAPTRFGAGSAAAHADLGWQTVRVPAAGLRTDVDDAASLADAVALGVGAHTAAALGRATLPGVQATIHRVPDETGGSALLDDGREVEVPIAALVDSGLLHLRSGQRVSIELDADGLVATRAWIVGIGPGETIH
ncbi:2-phospho-L-lactate guanylyltransferase [Phycicoccus mangrovi]|uniref:2-phospho-L-lactate guanylyltransferase n=1 Tax=Phycicoccus mangrovi TaxID=2840470 RepID=UPI0027E31054|nr:2-phospho-L-lactate guanylyltransferase [Phycicoccus mangrovi]